jgi:hypothetical protein
LAHQNSYRLPTFTVVNQRAELDGFGGAGIEVEQKIMAKVMSCFIFQAFIVMPQIGEMPSTSTPASPFYLKSFKL